MENTILLGKKLYQIEKGAFTFEGTEGPITVVNGSNKYDFKETLLFKDNKKDRKIQTKFDEQDYNFIIINYFTKDKNGHDYTRILIVDKDNNLVDEETSVVVDGMRLKIFGDNQFVLSKDERDLTGVITSSQGCYFLTLGMYTISIDKDDFNKVYLNGIKYDGDDYSLKNFVEQLDNNSIFKNIFYNLNGTVITLIDKEIDMMRKSIEMYTRCKPLLRNNDNLELELLDFITDNYTEQTILRPKKRIRK